MLYVVLYREDQDLRETLRTVVCFLPMKESLFPNQEIRGLERSKIQQKPQQDGVKNSKARAPNDTGPPMWRFSAVNSMLSA